MLSALSAAALAVSPTASAQETLWAQKRVAVAASPQAIADMAVVTNDPQSSTIEVSTEPFNKRKYRSSFLTTSDEYVRVLIDKETGAAVFEIHVVAQHLGQRRFYNRVRYQSIDGRANAAVERLSEQRVLCVRLVCEQIHLSFEVPERFVRAVTADAKAGVDSAWTFNIYNVVDGGKTITILKTELAEALIAAKREAARHKFRNRHDPDPLDVMMSPL